MMEKRHIDDSFTTAAESIVGASVKIDGDLKSQGNLRIDGTVSGKVSTTQNLYIGETASITADLSAENITLGGAVQGNIKTAGALKITRTGRLVGDITCGILQVEEGAYFAGKCQMKGREDIQPFMEKTEKNTSAPTAK